jgi:hypothetical protein
MRGERKERYARQIYVDSVSQLDWLAHRASRGGKHYKLHPQQNAPDKFIAARCAAIDFDKNLSGASLTTGRKEKKSIG